MLKTIYSKSKALSMLLSATSSFGIDEQCYILKCISNV